MIAALLLSLFAHPAMAQESCMPTYTPVYNTCVASTKTVTMISPWILVKSNFAGYAAIDDTCDAALPGYAAMNPAFTNLKSIDIDEQPSAKPGKDKKREVRCKYSMDTVRTEYKQDETCGIKMMHESGCEDGGLTADFTKQCLDSPADTQLQIYTKLTCLGDSYLQAYKIRGITPELDQAVQFNLQLMANSGDAGVAPVAKAILGAVAK